MNKGSKRVAWLFLIPLIPSAIVGLFSVPSVQFAPGAAAGICCIAQRRPGLKIRATRGAHETRRVDLSRAAISSAGPALPAPYRSGSLSVVWRDALYSRPPPVLSLA
jgi:hypothetical protein